MRKGDCVNEADQAALRVHIHPLWTRLAGGVNNCFAFKRTTFVVTCEKQTKVLDEAVAQAHGSQSNNIPRYLGNQDNGFGLNIVVAGSGQNVAKCVA